MRYFQRVYRLEIGEGDNIRTFDGFPDEVNAPAQITFRIDQTPNATFSMAEISIFGLKRDTRKAIYEEGETVNLVAGWLESYATIFNGKISNVSTGREGAETFVTLFCISRGNEARAAFTNQSFGVNTPQKTIIEAVANSFGAPVEFYGDFDSLPKAVKGKTIAMSSMRAMDELATAYDFEWWIENGRIVIVRDGFSRLQEPYTYTAATGLIGSPEITERGVNIDVVMNPLIRPWDFFQIDAITQDFSFGGIYVKEQDFPEVNGKGVNKVVSLVHEGDFYGDAWQTSLEGLTDVGQ